MTTKQELCYLSAGALSPTDMDDYAGQIDFANAFCGTNVGLRNPQASGK
jgi:hypothetical protein